VSERDETTQAKIGLIKAVIFSLLLAIGIFLTIVLPTEFGIDPTGVGAMLGLDVLHVEEYHSDIISRPGEGGLLFRQDEVEILIPANEGLEYKFFLDMHANLTYDWCSSASLYFDMHGEPDGDTSGYFESYGEASVDKMSGSITVPFAGSHGWYWRNDTDDEIIVNLKTLGNYEVIGLK